MSVQALEARVRAALDLEDTAWIGQQVVLQIDLMTSGFSFSGQRIQLPDVPGALVLEDAVSTVKLSESVNGETWQVLGYRYPLFPQRAGRIEIDSIGVTFEVSEGYGTTPEAFDVRTETLVFEVRTPPGVEDPAGLVTSPDFTLQVKVTPEPVGLRVGDALTRSVTRRAVDVSGLAFAPLPGPDIPGVASYAKSPEVDDSIHRGDLEGSRVESVTYVLQQPGVFTIPEIHLQWWDPVAERLHTETVPALTFEVAANPHQTPATDGLDSVLGLVSRHPWRALVVMVGMPVLLWAVFLWVSVGLRRLRHWRTVRQRSESARFRRLLRAARNNEPTGIYNAYVKWASGEAAPDPVVLNDPMLSRELERLQTMLVQPEAGWQADALVAELQRVRRSARLRRRIHKTRALPELNPKQSFDDRIPWQWQ
jgi:hypothetical protein